MKRLIFKFLILGAFGLPLWSCTHQASVPTQASTVVEPKAVYLQKDFYAEFKSGIPDYPKKNTLAQKADEKELRLWQKKRTVEDCKRASSEVDVSLQTTYGQPYGPLTSAQIQTLLPLFARVRKDGGPYISLVKDGYTRQRPYDYIKGLQPCVEKVPSYAYPSGHATLAELFYLVLKDLFPEQEHSFHQRADQIGLDRIIGGVHHPTDVEAGKKLGLLIYSEIKKSPVYAEDIEKYKKLLNTSSVMN